MNNLAITDEYINNLFKGTNFGDPINKCVVKKREQIAKTLRNLRDGYWAGHTAYHIVVNGGLIEDGKKSEAKVLTELGELFLKDIYLNK